MYSNALFPWVHKPCKPKNTIIYILLSTCFMCEEFAYMYTLSFHSHPHPFIHLHIYTHKFHLFPHLCSPLHFLSIYIIQLFLVLIYFLSLVSFSVFYFSSLLALGMGQSCFEGAMYTFVFMWTPALKRYHSSSFIPLLHQ